MNPDWFLQGPAGLCVHISGVIIKLSVWLKGSSLVVPVVIKHILLECCQEIIKVGGTPLLLFEVFRPAFSIDAD